MQPAFSSKFGNRQVLQSVSGSKFVSRQVSQPVPMSRSSTKQELQFSVGSSLVFIQDREPSVSQLDSLGLFIIVVLQSSPQKPVTHSTLKLMTMWDMLWYPLYVLSSVKSTPSWRSSRSINRLSIMLGRLLSTASMKNCILPCQNQYSTYSFKLILTYCPWKKGPWENRQRVCFNSQEASWPFLKAATHFTEWTCWEIQSTVSEGVWWLGPLYCNRPRL